MFLSHNLPEHNPYLGSIREHLPDSMWIGLTDEEKWHNVFYEEITTQINEELFAPLYSEIGRPNSPIYLLVAMLILKSGKNWTDKDLFENIRYHMLCMVALGLELTDEKPCDKTYYAFKVRLELYKEETGIDLLKDCFQDLTAGQAARYGVQGKKIRTDGKQFSSNVAQSNRLELVISVAQKFYISLNEQDIEQLEISDQLLLEGLVNKTAANHTYGLSKSEKTDWLNTLGSLLHRLVKLFDSQSLPEFDLIQRLFTEQFKITEEQVELKKKTEISGKTLQTAHDTDAKYIKKGSGKTQQIDIGFGANLTETIDSIPQAESPESTTSCEQTPPPLRLITDVEIFGIEKGEKECLVPGITNTEKITKHSVEEVSSDGNYHCPQNVQAIEQLNEQENREQAIEWHVAAMQGTLPIFDFEWVEEGQLKVTILATGVSQIAKRMRTTYRITLEDGTYRYIYPKQVTNYFIRKKIEDQPPEVRNRRANVEATVGHVFATLGGSNGRKTKYRGLFRNSCFVINRCCWVNYRRIMLYRQRKDENSLKQAA